MSNQPPPFAEYPRPSNDGGFQFYNRGPGVYFSAIGEGWNFMMSDLGTWIAATIVYFVVAYGLSLPISILTQPMMLQYERSGPNQLQGLLTAFAIQMTLNLIPTAITATLGVGMISMGVKKVRGEYINVGMIFEPFKRFGTIFAASLLYYLICFAATLACVLPVFFFGPVLYLVPVVAYIRGVNPMEALSMTFDACKAHWLGLLGLYFVLGLVILLGFCACGVGALFAWPTFCLVMAIHYRAFFESSGLPDQSPMGYR